MNYLDPGFIGGAAGGALGVIAGLACFILSRRHRSALERAGSALRSELNDYKAECSAQIEQLGRNVSTLELSAQNVDEAGKGGLTRSVRSQAMHLLRSGMPPDSAASVVGLGKREMRLIASVSGILALK